MMAQAKTTKTTAETEQPRTLFNRISAGAKWGARFLVWPTKKWQTSLFFACTMGVGPVTGVLFPNAEDVLQDDGLSPELVQDLAGDAHIDVRVFDTLPYYAHTAVSKPNALLWMFEARDNKTRAAYARPMHIDLDNIVSLNNLGQIIHPVMDCIITIPKKDQANAEEKNHFGVTEAQNYRFVLFHELRHCHVDNRNMTPFMKEVDADYQAAKKLAEVEGDPELLKKQMYSRAYNIEETRGYNNAIYFDAQMRGDPLPTENDIRTANAYLAEGFEKGCIVLNEETPEWSRRRVELFIFAYQHVALEQNHQYETAHNQSADVSTQDDKAEGTAFHQDATESLTTEKTADPYEQTDMGQNPQPENKTIHIVPDSTFCTVPSRPAPVRPAV